jgi:hypothetical protein
MKKNFLNILLIIIFIIFFFTLLINIINKKKNQKSFRRDYSNNIKGVQLTPLPKKTPTIFPQFLTPTIPYPLYSASGKTINVKPEGDLTIEKALELAYPGDIIELSDGNYYQDIITKKNGLPDKPIIIRGSKNAIVRGDKRNRIIEINHDYIILDGFTIDGFNQKNEEKSNYKDKLIFIVSKIPNKGIVGTKILNMNLKNAGGECIRLRYFTKDSEIAYNTIGPCGLYDFRFNGKGKNGEGIYIGTAPEQLKNKKNPTSDTDISENNWIHHNYIDTQANECVDIKEGSRNNIVEYNYCTGQKDPESGGLDTRGNNNIFRFNTIVNNLGAGVRLGGDKKTDGINNEFYNNNIINNAIGIKILRLPQGKICGNILQNNNINISNKDLKINPEKPC